MPDLFEPLKLRDLVAPNRIWLASMCQYSSQDGMPNDWHLVHLGSRVTGGFGLVLTEATAVVPEGRISPQDTGIWNDAQMEAWRPVTEFAAKHNTPIGVQLAHAGRKASVYRPWAEQTGSVPESDGGWGTVGPSAVEYPGLAVPAEMTTAEIAETVKAFADAARRSLEAGFDTIEIHGAHGYLVHQFLSPLSNRRTDEYGGSFANRIRLLVEIVEATREVWPEDKPLMVRLSATDWVPGGWDGDQTTELAGVLKGIGVDFIDVSTGGNAQAKIAVGPGYQVPFAAQVKAGSGIATGAVGMITEAEQAQEIVASGQADVVLVARVGLREPSWPQRIAHELNIPVTDARYPAQYLRGTF
jgi:2,4-dienoyl-CoA reductase-like NADH-dependent reductase (Old Yellow Enzyme family)